MVRRACPKRILAWHEMAVAVDRLKREPVFTFEAGGRGFVVITSKGGANHGRLARVQAVLCLREHARLRAVEHGVR